MPTVARARGGVHVSGCNCWLALLLYQGDGGRDKVPSGRIQRGGDAAKLALRALGDAIVHLAQTTNTNVLAGMRPRTSRLARGNETCQRGCEIILYTVYSRSARGQQQSYRRTLERDLMISCRHLRVLVLLPQPVLLQERVDLGRLVDLRLGLLARVERERRELDCNGQRPRRISIGNSNSARSR